MYLIFILLLVFFLLLFSNNFKGFFSTNKGGGVDEDNVIVVFIPARIKTMEDYYHFLCSGEYDVNYYAKQIKNLVNKNDIFVINNSLLYNSLTPPHGELFTYIFTSEVLRKDNVYLHLKFGNFEMDNILIKKIIT